MTSLTYILKTTVINEMTTLLVKLFIKDCDKVNDPKIRTKYGILSGGVGIFINIVLCCIKFAIGFFTNSIAITADAANNLSDAGSSAVTLIGFKLSGKPADKEHPFGHGRTEYITAFIVALLIIFMGIEFLKSSVEKIITPEPVKFSLASAIILGSSILLKLWLAVFNKKLGKKIDSAAMTAVFKDSISDMLATSVTLGCLILSKYTDKNIDGYPGIVVSLFVLFSGFGILKDTISSLIGKPPSKELVDKLENKILSYDGVEGIHDLMLHDYGPGRLFGSVHVEVPSNVDIMVSHDIIDNIEKEIKEQMGIMLVIHLDPIVVDEEAVISLKTVTEKIVNEINPEYSIHDFRVVKSPSHTNLIFDLVIPYGHKQSREKIADLVSQKIKDYNSAYFCVITVEHSFV